MYNYLYGQITEKETNYIVVDCSGIGYEVNMTSTSLSKIELESEQKIYTYLNVKEDEMSLYGFLNKAEKEMFVHLISISGIGPKLALSIMGGIELNDLAICIVSGNAAALNGIKGVGKKTAERIIIELKDKIVCSAQSAEISTVSVDATDDAVVTDASMYLIAMGINKVEAVRKVKAVLASEDCDKNKLEDIVVKALAVK